MLISLITLAIYIHEVTSLITRLPCRWHANFSRVEENKKYRDTVLKTTKNLDYTKCLTLCISEVACSFVNFNILTMTCELLVAEENAVIQEKLSDESNWKFASTKLNRTAVRCNFFPTRFFKIAILRNCFEKSISDLNPLKWKHFLALLTCCKLAASFD